MQIIFSSNNVGPYNKELFTDLINIWEKDTSYYLSQHPDTDLFLMDCSSTDLENNNNTIYA